MNLFLHTPNKKSELSRYYRQAFKNAVELFIVSAYLTEWNDSLRLNQNCNRFRVIVGKDFGITRKAACEAVMRWLPSKRKAQFMVADQIDGFHPKAVLWKEANGDCFAIVGSSNLTKAAFEKNFEANIFFQLSEADYIKGKQWVKHIEKLSVVVSNDWLKKYKEAPGKPGGGTTNAGSKVTPLMTFKLPKPQGVENLINRRRDQIKIYNKYQTALSL